MASTDCRTKFTKDGMTFLARLVRSFFHPSGKGLSSQNGLSRCRCGPWNASKRVAISPRTWLQPWLEAWAAVCPLHHLLWEEAAAAYQEVWHRHLDGLGVPNLLVISLPAFTLFVTMARRRRRRRNRYLPAL